MNPNDQKCPLHRWMPRSHRYAVTECGGSIQDVGGGVWRCNRCSRRWSATDLLWLERARQAGGQQVPATAGQVAA